MPPKPKRKYERKKRPLKPQRVKLIQRKRATGIAFLARYQHPVTGAWKQESLTREGYTDEAACRKWCEDKTAELIELARDHKAGRAPKTQTTIIAAVKQFREAKAAEVATGTLEVYAEATDPFTAWAAREGVRHVESLDGPTLFKFRNWIVAQPAHGYVTGHGMKGKCIREPNTRKLSPQTINKKLRAMRTVCAFWRDVGYCPDLHTDTIRRVLKFVKVKKAAPEFLRAPEIRKLLEAVKRHDAQLDDGNGHKHPPIGDFLTAALLSGMRFGELATLKWSAVDFDAREIRLSEDDTKTGHARAVDLDVTPALLALLARRQLAADGCRFVFGTKTTDERGRVKHHPMSRDVAESARKRLTRDHKAPRYTWHLLRKTAGTFLTCAPSIYGAASAFLSAKRLGHSVAIAERHYTGAVKGIDPAARDLETAMGIVDLLPSPVTAQGERGRA
jgi:integrase